MASYNNGIEALKAGDFRIRIQQGMGERPGIIDDQEVILLWNYSGDNPCWKKEAVAEYQRQQCLQEFQSPKS